MRKIYLLLATALTAASMQAQLVLTQANYENMVGDMEISNSYDTTTVLPRNTGQNQTWNFSSITTSTNSADTVWYVSPSTIPSASLFPGTNLATINGPQYYSFFKSSSSPAQVEYLGYDDVHAYANYTNTAIEVTWPIAYGYTHTDTYNGPLTGQSTGTRGGTVSLAASGSGTLIMPGGQQFTNVLQVTIKTTDQQNATGFNSLTITSTAYNYYRAGERSSFLTVDDAVIASSTGTFGFSSVGTTTTSSGAPTGIKAQSADLSFFVFPNPAKTMLNVVLSNTKNEACTVKMYNAIGTLVKEADAGNTPWINAQLQVSDLAAGIYFVKINLGGKEAIKKMVIE